MGLGLAQVFVQAPFDDVPMNNILKSNPFGPQRLREFLTTWQEVARKSEDPPHENGFDH